MSQNPSDPIKDSNKSTSPTPLKGSSKFTPQSSRRDFLNNLEVIFRKHCGEDVLQSKLTHSGDA